MREDRTLGSAPAKNHARPADRPGLLGEGRSPKVLSLHARYPRKKSPIGMSVQSVNRGTFSDRVIELGSAIT